MTAPLRTSSTPPSDVPVADINHNDINRNDVNLNDVNLNDTNRTAGGHTERAHGPSDHTGKTADRQSTPLYYDVPLLKAPVWKWEICSYFFLGGLSAGAYILARLARRFGPERYRAVTDAGTAVAFATLIPCPILLIHDLGDWKRFHYMLRVFKPKSPMNVGSWTLTGYGALVTLAALNQWRKASQRASNKTRLRRNAGDKLAEPTAALRFMEGATETLLDGAGIPLALELAGYTGVLLSTTANPLWTRNSWLGSLFSASAISTGATAIRLTLAAHASQTEDCPEAKPLHQVEAMAKVAEAVTLAGYLTTAGKLAEPITKGKYSPHLWGGAVGMGLVASTVLGNLPVKSERTRRALRIGGAIAGLAGGLALRWAIVQGGRPSGNDPQAARTTSRPTE